MVKQPKLALAMIVKGDEGEGLSRCLNSVAKYVDGMFIAITTEGDSAKQVCEEYGAVYEYVPGKFHHTVTEEERREIEKAIAYDPVVQSGDSLFLFDKARNYNWSMVPKEFDWILWLDADDILLNPQNLKPLLEVVENREKPADAIFVNYIYLAEIEDGKIKNVIIEHMREQLVRNGDLFKWVAPIHETLIEQRPTEKIMTKDIERLHLSSLDKFKVAIGRNIKNLEYSILQTKGEDPRPIYYLAKAHFDLKDENSLRIAEKLFKVYLYGTEEKEGNNRSGWPQERSQCWTYLSDTYRMWGQYNNCIKAAMNALIEDSAYPSTYLNIALAYLNKQDYEAALRWVRFAAALPQPQSTLVVQPKEDKVRALEILYVASLNLSKLDDARRAAHKLLELHPDSQAMQERVRFVDDLYERRESTKAMVQIAKHLQATGEVDKLRMLVQSAPNTILNNPFVADMRRQVFPPKTWQDDEVAIYCGPGWTPWSPKLLENPKGSFMGGSEEAVVYLAKELTELGWKVTVYADPADDAGEHDGVVYLPHYEFNSQDQFNILVGWRRPEFADGGFNTKKLFLWMHDIQNHLNYTKERLEKIDKVIVLSPWHRENIPNVPDEKIMISNNGITL